MGKLRRWWARIQEWRRAPARAKELQRTNYILVKGGLRDRARIAQLEKELALERAATWDELPGLTPAEIERLAMLAEECGEVVQAVGMVLRHGWESSSPFESCGRQNRGALEKEIGNVRAVVNLMLDVDDLSLSAVQSWQGAKRKALPKWTHHQPDSMSREEQLAMMEGAAIEQSRV